MASETRTQNIDDLLACMAGMGFALDDCRAAVEAGKLTIEDAVEWLLAGKPSVEPSHSSGHLRLGQPASAPVGANPFRPPPPAPAPLPDADSLGSLSSLATEEPVLMGRLHGTEEQRREKERFEEQQRNVAKKKAVAEKKAQKEDHSRILAQIKEDREAQRLRTLNSATGVPSGGVVGHASCAGGGNAQNVARHANCVLQIRLPDGRALKKTFPSDALLGEVWSFIKLQFRNCDGMCLMQPFPRQEFGESHMESTLRELQLIPTGSLVLKKIETPQVIDVARSDASIDTDETQPCDPSSPSLPPSNTSPSQQASSQPSSSQAPIHPSQAPGTLPPLPPTVSPVSHHWGSGHTMMEGVEGAEGEEGEGVHGGYPIQGNEEEMGNDEELYRDEDGAEEEYEGEDDGDDVPYGPHHMPGWGQDHNFIGEDHMWGEGQSLMGLVWNNDNLPHHHENPTQLAAIAARQRYASCPPSAPTHPDVPTLPQQHVRPLLQTVMRHVSGRICDTRRPITGLQGLPAQLASRVLQHLVKERLLYPRTLQPFISCHLHSINLDGYPYNTNELMAAIRHHTNLVSLSLFNSPLISDKGLQPLTALKRLRSLNLGGCRQLTNNCLIVLSELPAMTTVCLEDTGVTNEGVTTHIPQCIRLQRLDLSRTQVNQQIFQALRALPVLKFLGLEQTMSLCIRLVQAFAGISLASSRKLALSKCTLRKLASLEGVQHLTSLEVLNVGGTAVDTESMSCLSRVTSLVALNIANTQNVNGDAALEQLSALSLQSLQLPSRLSTTGHGMSFISAMPLRTLDLTNYINVGDVGIEHVGKIHSLQRLILSNANVTDVGMATLNGLTNLQELVLTRTSITDIGAAVIGEFTNLKELSLSQTCISNRLLKSAALNKCIFLAKLNLSKTNISDKGITHLRLPSLTLLNVDCTRVRAATVEALPGCPRLQRVYWKHLLNPGSDGSS